MLSNGVSGVPQPPLFVFILKNWGTLFLFWGVRVSHLQRKYFKTTAGTVSLSRLEPNQMSSYQDLMLKTDEQTVQHTSFYFVLLLIILTKQFYLKHVKM